MFHRTRRNERLPKYRRRKQQIVLCCYAGGHWWSSRNDAKWRGTTYRWRNLAPSKHLLNLNVLPTSKALKLYTTLSLISTTNCVAPMYKRKLDNYMMNCGDRFKRFNETLTNWHWMSSVKYHAFVANDSAWHVQTMKYEAWFIVKKNLRTWLGCILKREITVMICAKTDKVLTLYHEIPLSSSSSLS